MTGRADLAALQAAANRRAGPRHVPAREIPVPAGLDATDAELVAAAYSPAWNLAPEDDAAWQNARREMEARVAPVLARTRENLGVSLTRTSAGGIGAYLLVPDALPEAHRDQLVVFLHGGGYVLGAGESGTAEAALMAAYGGFRVLSLDYRLAPEARHPAALDDAVASWRAIVQDTDAARIAVGGLSAGGGLALALVLRIRDEGLPLPAALSLGSPWTDVTDTGDSYRTNEWLDNVLVSHDGYLSRAARKYAGDRDLREPGLSPINGDMRGLPPAILSSGTRDLFLSNTVRTHRKLRDAGNPAELHVYEGMSHAQFALTPGAAVTLTSYREIAAFFDRHLAGR